MNISILRVSVPERDQPYSIKTLRSLAEPSTYDPTLALEDQLDAVQALRLGSSFSAKRADYQLSYVCLTRAAILAHEILPTHPEYCHLSAQSQVSLKEGARNMLNQLAELEAVLRKRRWVWKKRQGQSDITSRISKDPSSPYEGGTRADVYRGFVSSPKNPVAINAHGHRGSSKRPFVDPSN